MADARSAILSLPTELIVAIVSYLSPFTLRGLLKIHNRRFFEIINAAYKPHRWYVENAFRHTRDRFKLPPSPQTDERSLSKVLPDHNVALHAGLPPLIYRERVPRAVLGAIGLDAECDGFISANPPFLRGWMKLDGSLDWLAPPISSTAPSSMPHGHVQSQPTQRQLAQQARRTRHRNRGFYEQIQKQTHKLGLTLPPAFVNLYTSDRLLSELPQHADSSWLAGSQVLRCPRCVDGLQHDGYIIPFYRKGSEFSVSLYLERTGWSCVILSTVRPNCSNANLGILSRNLESSQGVPGRGSPPGLQRSFAGLNLAPRQSRDSWQSILPEVSESDAREREEYLETARRLARLNICDEDEVYDAAREGLQVGLNLLFHGPVTIVGLTFEEFLVSFYLENELTLYFSHLNRSPSKDLKEYVARRYMPLYYDTEMKGKPEFLASFGDVYL